MNAATAWPPLADQPVRISRGVWRLLAPNASFITYEGTNTYLLAAEGEPVATVVDPGTADAAHLDAIVAFAQEQGWHIERILLTHDHNDHSDGARELADRLRVPIIAASARWGDELIGDGSVIELGFDRLRVFGTPGHSDDSVALLLESERSLLTGDTVLANNSSAIFGGLHEFFDSVARIRGLVEQGSVQLLVPAHGPVADDPAPVLDNIVARRLKRLAEIQALVARGVDTAGAVTDVLYPGAARGGAHRWFPELTVRSYLDYIKRQQATEPAEH